MDETTMSCANLALGLFDRIWNGVTSVRQQKLSAQNYLRACYLEVKANRELPAEAGGVKELYNAA
jgi:hypothetical protein